MDSVVVTGDPAFRFEIYLESPQVLYLYLNKVDGTELDDRILFFAEPGEISLNTTLENFEGDAVVEGSKNQEKLVEYRKMMQRFNSKNLDLIKANFEAQKENDEELVQNTLDEYNSLVKRRYLFTVNFALNNNDLEVAPYLAISEVYDANVKYLDTIFKSLTPEVRDSKYGQSLEEFFKTAPGNGRNKKRGGRHYRRQWLDNQLQRKKYRSRRDPLFLIHPQSNFLTLKILRFSISLGRFRTRFSKLEKNTYYGEENYD